jgi:Xaa-Pro aminopeptidase
MRQDLDKLMAENQAEAILVTGSALHNPEMYYFTGGGHISQAEMIKVRGKSPVIYCSMMEREEAAKTGLETRVVKFGSLTKRAGGDRMKANMLRYQDILVEAGITKGKVILYGKGDIGWNYSVIKALEEAMPGLEIMGDVHEAVLTGVMETKDEKEIEHIRKMGKVTTEVVGMVADFLRRRQVKDEVLLLDDGQPVTVGFVKNKINLWLAERGAENPEDTIFSIGRDGGIPHSSGTPTDVIRLGQPIVFDIYPCESGGGYFYDFTRTWCFGYAPEKVQKLFDQVKSVYDTLIAEFKIGEVCYTYQKRTCDLFEAQGHPTVLTQSDTVNGYNHSISHGLGLHVHEKPWFGLKESLEVIKPGSVFTIEPGLYYPDQGMGVRLEDTFWANPNGKIEKLAEYPYDLVIPMIK